MPLLAHAKLPSLNRLESEGLVFTSKEEVENLSYDHEIDIGFINMMSIGGIGSAERMFVRSLALQEDILVHFYPTLLPQEVDQIKLNKTDWSAISPKVDPLIYPSLKEFMGRSYDGLIVTGRRPTPNVRELNQEKYWQTFKDIVDWSKDNINSTLYSCLSAHAAAEYIYGLKREIGGKVLGIFEHDIYHTDHPMLKQLEETISGAHSHRYSLSLEKKDISESAFMMISPDLKILATDDYAGIYLAASEDSKTILFQGHPEYGKQTLRNEFYRDINDFLSTYTCPESDAGADYRKIPDCFINDIPRNYFDPKNYKFLTQKNLVKRIVDSSILEIDAYGREYDEFFSGYTPAIEKIIPEFKDWTSLKEIGTPWIDQGQILFNNWLNLVAEKS